MISKIGFEKRYMDLKLSRSGMPLTVLMLLTPSVPCLFGALELLKPDVRTVMPFDFSNRPLSKWENGLLLTFGGAEHGPEVTAFDRAGAIVVKTHVNIPGVDRIVISDIASNGVRIVVGGTAANDSGVWTGFLAWIDRLGHTQHVVRTAPFAPIRLCFGSDGTLWALGREYTTDYREQAQYNMLRQYDDASGEVVRTALPRATLAQGVPHPAAGAFMTSGPNHVAILTRQGDWIEVSSVGAILKHRRIQLGKAKLGGLAITGAGIPFVVAHMPSASGEPVSQVLQILPEEERGVEVMRDGLRRILGSDGESVVGAMRLPEVVWMRVKR